MSTTHSCLLGLYLGIMAFTSPVSADISWVDEEDFSIEPVPRQEVVQQSAIKAPVRGEKQPDLRDLSEAFGHFIGRDLSKQGVRMDLEAVLEGIQKGAKGNPSNLSEEEYEQFFANFRDRNFQQLAGLNLRLANTFMAANAHQEGIVEAVPSQVQYRIIRKGRGRTVAPHSIPKLIFKGHFVDGTVFGATEPGSALPVPLDQMIPGFREGVIGMREGEERKVYVHPELAYGVTGEVPPNSLLIFNVEVVDAGDNAHNPAPFVQPHPERQNYSRRVLPPPQSRDDWDLTLDDAETDNFSARRLVLEPVTPQQNKQSSYR